MEHNAAIPKERRRALLRRRIQITERSLVIRPRRLAVLAAQIADLAGLRLGRVADGLFAADERVQMRLGAGAVPVGGDGLVVDVVEEGSPGGREAGDVDGEDDADAVGGGGAGHGAAQGGGVFVLERGFVGDAFGETGDDFGVAEGAGSALREDGGGGEEGGGEDRGLHFGWLGIGVLRADRVRGK